MPAAKVGLICVQAKKDMNDKEKEAAPVAESLADAWKEHKLARAAISAAATELSTADESEASDDILRTAEKVIVACDLTAAATEKLAMLGWIPVAVAQQTLKTAARVRKKSEEICEDQRRSWKTCVEELLFWCVL